MFTLCDLRFVLCSLHLDVVRAQRIMGCFIVITHKSTRSEKPIDWCDEKYFQNPKNKRHLLRIRQPDLSLNCHVFQVI